MKAIPFSAAAAALLLLTAAGCSERRPAAERRPERVLSLSAAATHQLTALGAPPAAIDEYGRIAAGDPPPPVIGRGAAVSAEAAAALGIDSAVVWSYQTDAGRQFRARGWRVLTIPPLRLADCPELLVRLGDWIGRPEAARRGAEELRRKLAEAVAAAPEGRPRRVYFELYSPGKAAADESYLGDLLRAAGGRSILPRRGVASREHVLEAAPEVIFYIEGAGDAGELAARPGLAETPAVREGRIYPVPRRLVVEGLAPLEAIAYLNERMR